MSDKTEVQNLEEGNEIVLTPATGATGIVEEVRTEWARVGSQTRTRITLTDGRVFTVRPTFEVTVLS